MVREILIDCEAPKYVQHGTGFEGYIRASAYEVDFIVTLNIDGRPSVRKRFNAHFYDFDLDDEQKLAQKIISGLIENRQVPEIWDVPNPPLQPGDNIYINFTDTAKQMFEFLKQYSQKLIEAFSMAGT